MAVVIIPLKQFPRRFGKFIKGLDSFKPFFGDIVKPLLLKWTEEHFKSEGPGWAEWSPEWALVRARSGGVGGILVWNNILRASISGGVGHYEEIKKQSIKFGTNVEYAAVQQMGRDPDNKTLRGGIEDFIPYAGRVTYGGGKGIPPRPYLYLSEANVDDLTDYALVWTLDKAKQALGGT